MIRYERTAKCIDLHGFFVNVCERRSQIHVPTIEQADDVGMISLQESHTKGIAKPGTASTYANCEGRNLEVLML